MFKDTKFTIGTHEAGYVITSTPVFMIAEAIMPFSGVSRSQSSSSMCLRAQFGAVCPPKF